MGIFNRLFGRKNAEIIDTPDKLAAILGAWYDTDSGIQITPTNALQITTVYQCVRVLAESVGMLPLNLMVTDGVNKQKAISHRIYRLLKVAPNSYQTAQEWKELVIAHLMLSGNHYSYINRVNGRVLELLPLAPSSVQPKLNDNYEAEYKVTFANGQIRTLSQDEVLHFRLFSTDGLVGLSPVSQARNALGLARATEQHGSKLFKNGAQPTGGFKAPGNLSDKQFESLKKDLESRQGSENSFKPFILEGGLDWVQVSITPEDAQFLETRKFQRSEICGMFRVPPHKIGDLERATFSNIEHQGLEFVTDSLMPHLKRLEERLNISVLSDRDQANHYFKFNETALLRGDMASRAAYYTQMLQNGAISPNEIREKEDMNPREGGDVYLTPLNMAVNGEPPVEESDDADDEEVSS